MTHKQKPVIGISSGDINGIGIELIIKAFSDQRLLDICTPVVFASNKVVNFYRKTVHESNFSFYHTKELDKINPKQVTIFNCWDEEVNITPGTLNETGGRYAVSSLQAAVGALKEKKIEGLVTAPIHKANVQCERFSYTGHTPFLRDSFQARDVVMMLCADNMRVALVTEHVPISEVARHITSEAILSKLAIINSSLQKDFGISKPRIAVLGLNPHAGDEGLVGNEEQTIIGPAIRQAKNNGILAFGPYSADAFFARGQYSKFDAVLAMYHDQGLIPFKSLAQGEGVNYTAGLDIVRTSPDHGVAFDIAGKDQADAGSFLQAVYSCADIISQRKEYSEQRQNPMRKVAPDVVSRLEDEKIEE
ncbi:4-hydroxythreonine-4-phosphate dehydrogenase PdxA [Niabella ginsenosidivorans]|uniref:4-hydroxythreonine-4-phosphate dehydrogenase PdxA n=1 Tax=Niabella ginsenosidivorans TaxID=1176587 RepID=A0A1A9I9D0_9BACT|nr:4-hydroxythreonine-4-phosphate dehydrogenase PdxA [Niabella ginsenosidivorans]ANH83312.1 4-hydroxythreonine-4-phosphate dehydrogenase PdxA [Niabella ginsenosidivorans]